MEEKKQNPRSNTENPSFDAPIVFDGPYLYGIRSKHFNRKANGKEMIPGMRLLPSREWSKKVGEDGVAICLANPDGVN